MCVDVGFVSKFDDILPITQIRTIPELANMKLLQKGSRLSITPVTNAESDVIMRTIENRSSL
jgi:predicted RNA-binding protein with PUA-like domain